MSQHYNRASSSILSCSSAGTAGSLSHGLLRPGDSMPTGGGWRCTLCKTMSSGSAKKNSRPHGDGRALQACIKRHERGKETRPSKKSRTSPALSTTGTHDQNTEVLLAAIASTRDSEAALSPTVLVEATKTYDDPLFRTQQLSRFGLVRVPATDISRQLAWQVVQLHSGSRDEIAGGVQQFTPNELTQESNHQLKADLEKLVRSRATEAGVKDVDKMFVVDIKMLSAAPKHGDQFPHWDHARSPKAARMYTFLLCCTNGCFSTALPTYEFDVRLAYSNDPEVMQQVAHRVSDTPENLHSAPIGVGECILFQQTLVHKGVANRLKQGYRQHLFCVLSDTPEWGQDQRQVPPWLFVAGAFGWKSAEFGASLHENKKHGPIGRIQQDQGPAGVTAAHESLKLFKRQQRSRRPATGL
ncbi:MAG: hypothetical protein P4L40_01180 [Terracidiphilus sp.]|nr:hypothetical protein [Terracidiphilus sp.]